MSFTPPFQPLLLSLFLLLCKAIFYYSFILLTLASSSVFLHFPSPHLSLLFLQIFLFLEAVLFVIYINFHSRLELPSSSFPTLFQNHPSSSLPFPLPYFFTRRSYILLKAISFLPHLSHFSLTRLFPPDPFALSFLSSSLRRCHHPFIFIFILLFLLSSSSSSLIIPIRLWIFSSLSLIASPLLSHLFHLHCFQAFSHSSSFSSVLKWAISSLVFSLLYFTLFLPRSLFIFIFFIFFSTACSSTFSYFSHVSYSFWFLFLSYLTIPNCKYLIFFSCFFLIFFIPLFINSFFILINQTPLVLSFLISRSHLFSNFS